MVRELIDRSDDKPAAPRPEQIASDEIEWGHRLDPAHPFWADLHHEDRAEVMRCRNEGRCPGPRIGGYPAVHVAAARSSPNGRRSSRDPARLAGVGRRHRPAARPAPGPDRTTHTDGIITVQIAAAPLPKDGGFCSPAADAVWVRPGTPTDVLTAALRGIPAGRGIDGAEPGPGLAVLRLALIHTFV